MNDATLLQDDIAALRAAGIAVAEKPDQIPALLRERMDGKEWTGKNERGR